MYMMRTLRHLRDFMSEEQLKFLPGAMQVENCILLRQDGKDANGVYQVVLQVFDSKGTWIGSIERPDFIPNQK
jgi:hypothetical protein